MISSRSRTCRPSIDKAQGPRDTGGIGSLAIVVAMMAVVLAPLGCSNDTEPGDAQPAPDVSSFAPGGFDDLPRYRGSEEAGQRSEDGDVVSQSFFVEGATPQMVIEFYENELQGWENRGVRDVGEALTAEFREPGDDGRRLEVSATRTEAGGLDQTQTLQYSLVLHS